MSKKNYKSLIKESCEIEGCLADKETLDFHHIIEQSNCDSNGSNSNNSSQNIAILCKCHHKLIDSKRLVIIGVFPSTKLPNKRTLVYSLDSVKNIDIEIPYLTIKNKTYKI